MICRFSHSNKFHFYKLFSKMAPTWSFLASKKFVLVPTCRKWGWEGDSDIPVFSVPWKKYPFLWCEKLSFIRYVILGFSRKCFNCLGNSFHFFSSIQFCASCKYLDCMQLLQPICQPWSLFFLIGITQVEASCLIHEIMLDTGCLRCQDL